MQRMTPHHSDRHSFRSNERWLLSVIVGCLAVPFVGGCNQGRVFPPMASRRALDHSSPSMHGPSMIPSEFSSGVAANSASRDAATPVTAHHAAAMNPAKPASHRTASQERNDGVRVTRESAVPGIDIEPVEQRLTPTRSTSTAQTPPRFTQATASQQNESGIAPVSHVTTFSGLKAPASLQLPEGFDGVDVSGLMDALQDSPPEVQKAAIARLIAMSRKRATPTAQPQGIDEALLAAFHDLPELPTEVVDRGVNPTRIGNADPPAKPAQRSPEVTTTIHESFSDQLSEAAGADDVNLSLTDQPDTVQQVSLAKMQTPVVNDETPQSKPVAVEPIPATATLADLTPTGSSEMTDAELFDELVARLRTQTGDESDADRQRRQVVARHLMVLSGDPDRAVENLEGLTNEEQEFLRNQLLGLWTIIDPNGHPVASRRFSSALPAIRKATSHLAAASDSLEIRSLEFCTEIEAYGQIKPFSQRRFAPGQEVILYCEIENFVSDPVNGGFETRLQGSYDLLDAGGRRVSSQTLPEDHQVSKVRLRDYFIAYQMYLPDAIEPGKYQLRLTMEDIHGKKYGQSTVPFEIKR